MDELDSRMRVKFELGPQGLRREAPQEASDVARRKNEARQKETTKPQWSGDADLRQSDLHR